MARPAAVALSVLTGAAVVGGIVGLQLRPDDEEATPPPATAVIEQATAAGLADTAAGSIEHGVDDPHGDHEPAESHDAHELVEHEQLVRDYLEAAWTFLPDDELGANHRRASALLHPDNPASPVGILVTHVPPHGSVHRVEVLDLTLSIDTGVRTGWDVTTRQMVDGQPLAGTRPITSQVVIARWLDEPRIHSHTLDPDPVP